MQTGEYETTLDGKPVTLVFDWRAQSRAQAAHGPDVFKKLFDLGPDAVASVMAIGLKAMNPEWTKEKILDLSPPLIPVIKDIDKALGIAYFGPDGPPASEEQAEPEKKT